MGSYDVPGSPFRANVGPNGPFWVRFGTLGAIFGTVWVELASADAGSSQCGTPTSGFFRGISLPPSVAASALFLLSY